MSCASYTPDSSTSVVMPVFKSLMITAALSLTTTREAEARTPDLPPVVVHELTADSSLSGFRLPDSCDGSENDTITHEQVANSLMLTLARSGITVDRRNMTADGSVLMEFLSGRQACVDVYPTGEIVVIVTENGRDNVFELGISDTNRIVELVRDGLGL